MGAVEEARVKWPGRLSTIYGFAGAVASEAAGRPGAAAGAKQRFARGRVDAKSEKH